MPTRNHWARRSEQLDPARDSHEISLEVSACRRVSFAPFRTYAVPSVGRLLDRTFPGAPGCPIHPPTVEPGEAVS